MAAISSIPVSKKSAASCRLCATPLKRPFVDLGMSPLANSYLDSRQLSLPEVFYPLRAFVCEKCLLVQLEELVSPEEIFSSYSYFSSYSATWLEHAREYAEMAISRFGLNESSRVVEIASNDGYLLQYFQAAKIPVLGIEPAANVAKAAEEKGIPTLVQFFGAGTAKSLLARSIQADLLVGNNVLAHVPQLNDFVEGLKILLKPGGVLTLEFPHLLNLVAENQFDTIYHEHFSYFSFLSARNVLATHGFKVFDVQEVATHGGSLRIFATHAGDSASSPSGRVFDLERREKAEGFDRLDTYLAFGQRVAKTKQALLQFLIEVKRKGKSVVGYGAPAKGNTLLNYCGLRTDFLDYTVDKSPHKQGRFLPGTHIPIFAPAKVEETKPDYLLILPWNLKEEIMGEMAQIRRWGGQFVVPIPEVSVIP